MLKKLPVEKSAVIKNLFDAEPCTILLSYLQGLAGEAYVDNIESPKTALVNVGIFSFLGGKSSCIDIEEVYSHLPEHTLLTTASTELNALVESTMNKYSEKLTRYKFHRDKTDFNIAQLKAFSRSLPNDFKIEMIDKDILQNPTLMNLSEDILGIYETPEEFRKHGLGFVVLKDDKIVGGASSFSRYNGGIEIEVDTLYDYRRMGIASAVSATLILHCLENDLFPSWDAANTNSVGLAQKLGYILKNPYTSFHIAKKQW